MQFVPLARFWVTPYAYLVLLEVKIHYVEVFLLCPSDQIISRQCYLFQPENTQRFSGVVLAPDVCIVVSSNQKQFVFSSTSQCCFPIFLVLLNFSVIRRQRLVYCYHFDAVDLHHGDWRVEPFLNSLLFPSQRPLISEDNCCSFSMYHEDSSYHQMSESLDDIFDSRSTSHLCSWIALRTCFFRPFPST